MSATYADLVEQIGRDYERLSPSQQRLADKVVREPEHVALASINELAREVGVTESTVTRFAVRLGLRGYPGLTAMCREGLLRQAHLLHRFDELAAAGEPDDLVQRAAKLDQDNIVRTYAQLDPEQWGQAVEALAGSRKVYVVGLRKCYSVAHFLAYGLRLVREGVEQLGVDDGTLPEQLRTIGPDDACVGISIHRYTQACVGVIEFAKRRGATTIALTDDLASPLARHADVSFLAATDGIFVLRSLTAFMSLAQALVGTTATRLGAETRRSLLIEEELLQQFGIYWDNRRSTR